MLMEMGASQAPWCLSWVRAHVRLGTTARSHVRAVAYEAASAASAARLFWESQDLQDLLCEERPGEGLRFTGQNWSVDWNERAVAVGGGAVQFPDVDVTRDNGAQAVREQTPVDYRGAVTRWRTVEAVDPVEAVLAEQHVHLLHLDVQGEEQNLLRAGGFARLTGRISVVLLGTHGRLAEALALEHLPQAGFVLIDEEPCQYHVESGLEQLVQDGEQLWVSAPALQHLASVGLLANRALLKLAEVRAVSDSRGASDQPARSSGSCPGIARAFVSGLKKKATGAVSYIQRS
jgi:uncharacterized protein YciI